MKSATHFLFPKPGWLMATFLMLLGICTGSFAQAPTYQAVAKVQTQHLVTPDANKTYYLVPTSQPTRAATFEVYAGWDYALLSNRGNTVDKPNGTPVKVILQPKGTYEIQMQVSNYGWDYTYFNSGFSGISLDKQQNATQWVFEKAATNDGYLIWRPGNFAGKDYNCYMDYRTSGKAWLDCHGSVKPEVWNLVPAS